jgi:hypothetical protein
METGVPVEEIDPKAFCPWMEGTVGFAKAKR